MSTTDPFATHQQQILAIAKEHGITIEWTTGADWSANLTRRSVRIPWPSSWDTVAGCYHELGHIVAGQCSACQRDTARTGQPTAGCLQCEVLAWETVKTLSPTGLTIGMHNTLRSALRTYMNRRALRNGGARTAETLMSKVAHRQELLNRMRFDDRVARQRRVMAEIARERTRRTTV